MASTHQKQEEQRKRDIEELQDMHRRIMKMANRIPKQGGRVRFAPRPSVLRVVDTVTTYGAYQEPL